MSPQRTIPAVLDRIARELPDHPAVVTPHRTLTFAELRAEVRQAAAAIIDARRRTRRPGRDLVAEHLALGGGVPGRPPRRRRGRPAQHPLHRPARPPTSWPAPRRRCCSRCGEFLGADQGRRPRPRRRCPRCATSCGSRSSRTTAPGTSSWRAGTDLVRGGRPRRRRRRRRRRRHPVHLRHHRPQQGRAVRAPAVARASAAWAACGQVTSDDRYLCINPFFHNFGYKAGILACLQTGATLIPQLTFDPEQTMRAVQEHRITVLPGPPTIYQTLLDHPERARLRPAARCDSRSPARPSCRWC